MPLRFDVVIQKLKRRAAPRPKLAIVGGKAARLEKSVPATTPDVIQLDQIEPKRRKAG